MKVYFVGAGPGAPDLLTVRGAELIARCPVVLFAGSLVPPEVVARTRPGARVVDTAGLTLDQIVEAFREARDRDEDVARVHTGDPSLFGSIAEQLRRLDALGVAHEIVPGVSSFTAAAAALGQELTLPELSQTVIVTRAAGRTRVPEGERLADLARHGATMALFLSVDRVREVARALAPHYGADCPAAVVHRATWPDQRILRATLATLEAEVQAAGIASQAIILVGRVLGAAGFPDSRLYDPAFTHRFRQGVCP